MWQDFITAFSPFFDGFFGAVNSIIRIFFDIRIFDIPIIMYPIVIGLIYCTFNIIWRGKE